MWGLNETDLLMNYDWTSLINDIIKYGTRNSLLTSLMPTATTSQFMGNSESFEPRVTNIYTRSTLTGEYTIVNKYLIEKLIECDIWNKHLREEIIYDKGSIQNIDVIPTHIKNIFKTAFEIKQKSIIEQSVERGPFIDQSQSMNLFFAVPNYDKLGSAHIFGWKNKLKTGMYYLRTQPATDPIKFGIDPATINAIKKKRSRKYKKKEDREELSEVVVVNEATSNIASCENCSA